MIFLPKNLVSLAKLCADQGGRFSMTGPKVFEYEGEGPAGRYYQVVASDGYKLGVVSGPSEPAVGPAADALENQPNGVYEAVVPAKDWIEAFRMCGKDAKGDPEPLGLCMGEGRIAFATFQGMRVAAPVDGRYPDWRQIIPRHPVRLRLCFNAKWLIDVLSVALHFTDETERVELLFYGKDLPVGVMARGNGQTFDGLIVSLATQ